MCQSGLIVNISSFYPKLSRFIVVYICDLPVELQAKGYNVPDYPANPKERLSSETGASPRANEIK